MFAGLFVTSAVSPVVFVSGLGSWPERESEKAAEPASTSTGVSACGFSSALGLESPDASASFPTLSASLPARQLPSRGGLFRFGPPGTSPSMKLRSWDVIPAFSTILNYVRTWAFDRDSTFDS